LGDEREKVRTEWKTVLIAALNQMMVTIKRSDWSG
jgi:hypothetical protein